VNLPYRKNNQQLKGEGLMQHHGVLHGINLTLVSILRGGGKTSLQKTKQLAWTGIVLLFVILQPTWVTAQTCVTPPDGLVAWWPGNGDAKDVAGGQDGTLQNGATFATGMVGQAFSLAGNQQAVLIGNPTNLQLQSFTIDAWIKRSAASVGANLDYGQIFTYGLNGIAFGLRDEGRLFLSKVGVSGVFSDPLRVTDTNFHHVAVTKSGSTVVFYVDGIAGPAPAYDPGFTFTTNVAIGVRGDDLSESFPGLIDEVEIFNRTLSAEEIQSIYNAGSAGKCLPTPGCLPALQDPVSRWSAEGNANDSVDGNNGTLQNGATFAAGKIGQAFSFDGVDDFVEVPDSSSWDFGTGNFSVGGWFKGDALPSFPYATFIGRNTGTGDGWGDIDWNIHILANGKPEFQASNNGSPGVTLSAPTNVVDNQWHHIAVTRTGNRFDIYIDGISEANITSVIIVRNTANPVRFGWAYAHTSYLNSLIDEVEIYNRALSASEIQAIFKKGAPELCNGVDDNCNDQIDDDPVDAGQACETGEPGVCNPGTTICTEGALSCQPDNPLCPLMETCGNCADDDGDGKIDWLDSDCTAADLSIKKAALNLSKPLVSGDDKISLTGSFAQATIDPPTEGATLAFIKPGTGSEDPDTVLACIQIPANATGWVMKNGPKWSFKDVKGGSLGDPNSKDALAIKFNTKKLIDEVSATISEAEVGALQDGDVSTQLSIGAHGWQSTQPWRLKSKAKQLVTP
jgi:hypothetical protein